MRGVRKLAILPIRFYRRFLSPLKPPTCRFHPTCSSYAAMAVLAHGIVKGTLLAIWRILRCQPFCEGGFDPIPPPGRWRNDPPGPSVATEAESPGDGEEKPDSAP